MFTEDSPFFYTEGEEPKSNWFKQARSKVFCFLLMVFIGPLFLQLIVNAKRNPRRNRMKQRLKYFNPVIEKDFFGNEKVKWVGRDRPLSDEQLKELL